MNIITNPERSAWKEMLKRPTLNTDILRNTVSEVLNRIRMEGDKAVVEYEEKFDKVRLSSLAVTEKEFAEAEKEVHTTISAPFILRRSSKGKR